MRAVALFDLWSLMVGILLKFTPLIIGEVRHIMNLSKAGGVVFNLEEIWLQSAKPVCIRLLFELCLSWWFFVRGSYEDSRLQISDDE